MEDDLNFLTKWKTTSIFSKMEEDLNVKVNGRLLALASKLQLVCLAHHEVSHFPPQSFLGIALQNFYYVTLLYYFTE